MGSEVGASSATDSDGSVTWEDFFGTSTDLVPQLLGMFDELARKGSNGERIPVSIQKRLSLVAHSQRNSIFGHICANSPEPAVTMQPENRARPDSEEAGANKPACSRVEITVCNTDRDNETTSMRSGSNENSIYRREMTGGLMPEYGRRHKHLDRPLSGSSIASSTSSSGCSNQGNACSANNPYLASVESLADTCASSQGSADSGVVTTSEASCRVRDTVNQRRNTNVENSPVAFHRARYCDPERNAVERVLLEIVDTEAIYVEHLRQVIGGYLIFWRDDPKAVLQQLELSHLFSNIQDIFQFNREFLKEIEACGLDAISVAQTFTKHNSGFKVYTEYCTNYPRTVSILTDLMGREDTAKAFRERQAALGHALPLGSFLLKPVQRILKYHLLLENLAKEFEAQQKQLSTGEGRNAIEEALETMTGIAKHINAMKRRHEHAVRVQEIQSLLYGWPGPDLTTSGELVAEGRFRMRGAKAPRHAFLFDRMLLLTKKKEDGLLVYKAHIMCSNLMLIESIPGEPCSFHVIPFDNPRLQYTLQARNLEQKREWTLQIKRVMLENYNAVIPSHARQLVLQLGQSHHDDDAVSSDRALAKKQYSSPPEYLERRKQEKERRRSEAGLRQKKKFSNKSESVTTTPTAENSPTTSRKSQSVDESSRSRDQSLNRSLDGRACRVKDRFTNWRRKSEPGFQSYVSLNQSDDEQATVLSSAEAASLPAAPVEPETRNFLNKSDTLDAHPGRNSPTTVKDNNNSEKTHVRTVEEIVGHILMQNQEFHRLLEKQRTNSLANVRQQQRFNKHHRAVDTSDDSDVGEGRFELSRSNINNNVNNRVNRLARITRHEHRVRSNNAWNSHSSSQSRESPTLQLQYNNLRTDVDKTTDVTSKNRANRVYEKRTMFEAFKRQSIVTESKIIKTALRIREHSSTDDRVESEMKVPADNGAEKTEQSTEQQKNDDTNLGNYDNLQNVWDNLAHSEGNNSDSPTKPAVWLTKLCEGMPTSPQKCGSLPRSFQSPSPPTATITKARFLQRDGKPISERPFTIASDKPAEINLEDMERYASTYQPEGRIAKFPISGSTTSSSTFFYALDDNLTDTLTHTPVTGTTIHPDHKIYRATSGSAMLRNVLSKAGSRLQGLRSTASAETLEYAEEFDRSKHNRAISNNCKVKKKKNKLKITRESSTDIDEPMIGCIAASASNFQSTPLYYKQGSSGLGARIAQSDYADPSVLFFEAKRPESCVSDLSVNQINSRENEEEKGRERIGSDGDGFYEKCFETIENYVDTETDDAFRDSAIFSDAEEIVLPSNISCEKVSRTVTKAKVPPPIPVKRNKARYDATNQKLSLPRDFLLKPSIAHKPNSLKFNSRVIRHKTEAVNNPRCMRVTVSKGVTSTREQINTSSISGVDERNDVSAGQSQAGWVKKMVGQLQSQIET